MTVRGGIQSPSTTLMIGEQMKSRCRQRPCIDMRMHNAHGFKYLQTSERVRPQRGKNQKQTLTQSQATGQPSLLSSTYILTASADVVMRRVYGALLVAMLVVCRVCALVRELSPALCGYTNAKTHPRRDVMAMFTVARTVGSAL